VAPGAPAKKEAPAKREVPVKKEAAPKRKRWCDMRFFDNAVIAKAVLRRRRRKFSSCAVVGSGGRLLGAKLGTEIDSHAFVVRHNNAPTEGYERDVGSKTSLMVQSSGALQALQEADRKGHFHCPPRTQAIFYTSASAALRSWLPERCENETDSSQFVDLRDYIITERLSRSLRSPKTGDLMAGPTAILVALRVCAHPIDLYGFTVGNLSHYQKWPYHYYDDVTPNRRDAFKDIARSLDRFINLKFPGCINLRL